MVVVFCPSPEKMVHEFFTNEKGEGGESSEKQVINRRKGRRLK